MSNNIQSDNRGLIARFVRYMLLKKIDLFFLILRNTIPNLVLPKNGPVFITRFNDVQEALNRPEVFNVTYAPMMDPSVGPFMLARDGTQINDRDKGIMRSVLQRDDLPRVREMVAKLVDQELQPFLPVKKLEVIANISRKVPILLTGQYFGFPGPDLKSMFRWSRATQYDMFYNPKNDEEIHQQNIQAGQEMKAYLQQLMVERREQLKQNPELDDTFSRLLKSTFSESIHFDDERIITNIMGTLVGGVETTSQAVAQILEQLFKRPEMLEQAVLAAKNNDDELVFKYCWEALRFNPINPFLVRRSSQDYRIASGALRSKLIPRDRLVLICTRSAMRDGRQLKQASSFCIDRPDYHYMHLGYGLHTCLGYHISRVQIPTIVKRLILLPNLQPCGPIDFKGGQLPESYEVKFG